MEYILLFAGIVLIIFLVSKKTNKNKKTTNGRTDNQRVKSDTNIYDYASASSATLTANALLLHPKDKEDSHSDNGDSGDVGGDSGDGGGDSGDGGGSSCGSSCGSGCGGGCGSGCGGS